MYHLHLPAHARISATLVHLHTVYLHGFRIIHCTHLLHMDQIYSLSFLLFFNVEGADAREDDALRHARWNDGHLLYGGLTTVLSACTRTTPQTLRCATTTAHHWCPHLDLPIRFLPTPTDSSYNTFAFYHMRLLYTFSTCIHRFMDTLYWLWCLTTTFLHDCGALHLLLIPFFVRCYSTTRLLLPFCRIHISFRWV